jgi:hypothetical protein
MSTATAAPDLPRPPAAAPLTAAQRQLWELAREKPAPGALNLSYAVAIDGPLDPAALAGAFQDLVRDHEPLRTLYPEQNGSGVAVVTGEEVALAALRLTPAQPASPAEAATLAHEDRNCGFDLSGEAPIRARLLRLDERRHVLLLTLHHIAADGWSLYVLREGLSRCYAARLRDQPIASSRPAVECTGVARRQAEWLASPAPGQELSWWMDRLRGATARPQLLASPPSPPRSPSADLLRQVAVLPAPLTMELRRLARESGTSLFTVLLSAFQALSQAWLDCSEPVIGTLAANRTNAASSAVLGAHYNALLLNTGFGGDPSLAECLLRTSGAMISALDHQSLPAAVLAGRLEQELGWDPAAVPSLMFLLDRYPLDGLKLDGCRVTGLYLDGGEPPATVPAATTADLIFAVREAPDRLTLSVMYRPGAVEDASVLGAMNGYTELLAVMCDSPEAALSELALDELAAPTEPAGAEATGLALREVTGLAPVDAVSPVGIWAGTQLVTGQEGAR